MFMGFSWRKESRRGEIKIAFVEANTGNRWAWQVCNSIEISLPVRPQYSRGLSVIISQARRKCRNLRIAQKHSALWINHSDVRYNCSDVLHSANRSMTGDARIPGCATHGRGVNRTIHGLALEQVIVLESKNLRSDDVERIDSSNVI